MGRDFGPHMYAHNVQTLSKQIWDDSPSREKGRFLWVVHTRNKRRQSYRGPNFPEEAPPLVYADTVLRFWNDSRSRVRKLSWDRLLSLLQGNHAGLLIRCELTAVLNLDIAGRIAQRVGHRGRILYTCMLQYTLTLTLYCNTSIELPECYTW